MRARLGALLAASFAAAVPLVLVAAAPVRTPSAKKPTPSAAVGSPGSRTDFSGLWALDSRVSAGGSDSMDGAVLEVTQKGERLWIQPRAPKHGGVMAEEVIVDGRSYEKSLGGMGKGTLVAKWGTDGTSLWLETTAASDDDPRAAVQRSVWRLSEDRSTWVRETVTVQHGAARQSRMVFRRVDPAKATPPPATPAAKPR